MWASASFYIKIVICLLIFIALLEVFWPTIIQEGFTGLVSVGDSPNWSSWAPRRGDVGIGVEEGGYDQDERYFRGYVDIQGFGVNHDFCRMVSKKGKDDLFFACALAGTENLSSVAYKTNNQNNGFRLSRDDYMRDITGKGKTSYCRILKINNDTFETRCNLADDKGFSIKTIEDTDPPDTIVQMLTFYTGIVFWLRFRDDMVDYAGNLKVSVAGKASIDEFPANPPIARALTFDGISQFLRVGDSPDMSLGSKSISLRSLRAFSFWIRFDEFTNNAHILDFGNGPGKDNIFIGIVGSGNPSMQEERPLLCGEVSTVPTGMSGAQPPPLMSPQELMLTTAANVNDFECHSQEIFPNPKGNHLTNTPKLAKSNPTSADMIYELWEQKQRRMRIKVPGAFKLSKWTHVVITTDNNDILRPPISVYINNKQVYNEPAGFLPQASSTYKNYIGKSNWASQNESMNNKDELFRGALFDLRGYKTSMSLNLINDTYNWGKANLGL